MQNNFESCLKIVFKTIEQFKYDLYKREKLENGQKSLDQTQEKRLSSILDNFISKKKILSFKILLSCLFVYAFLLLDCWYFLYLDMRFTIEVKETESPLTIEF